MRPEMELLFVCHVITPAIKISLAPSLLALALFRSYTKKAKTLQLRNDVCSLFVRQIIP